MSDPRTGTERKSRVLSQSKRRKKKEELPQPTLTGVVKMIADLEEIVSTPPAKLSEMVAGSRFDYDLFKIIWPIRNLLLRNRYLLSSGDTTSRFLDAEARCERLEGQLKRLGKEPAE